MAMLESTTPSPVDAEWTATASASIDKMFELRFLIASACPVSEETLVHRNAAVTFPANPASATPCAGHTPLTSSVNPSRQRRRRNANSPFSS